MPAGEDSIRNIHRVKIKKNANADDDGAFKYIQNKYKSPVTKDFSKNIVSAGLKTSKSNKKKKEIHFGGQYIPENDDDGEDGDDDDDDTSLKSNNHYNKVTFKTVSKPRYPSKTQTKYHRTHSVEDNDEDDNDNNDDDDNDDDDDDDDDDNDDDNDVDSDNNHDEEIDNDNDDNDDDEDVNDDDYDEEELYHQAKMGRKISKTNVGNDNIEDDSFFSRIKQIFTGKCVAWIPVI